MVIVIWMYLFLLVLLDHKTKSNQSTLGVKRARVSRDEGVQSEAPKVPLIEKIIPAEGPMYFCSIIIRNTGLEE